MADRTKDVMLVTETFGQSVASDAFSVLCIVVVIGIGVLLQSSAMQWAGFALVALALLGRGLNTYNRMSPQDAADLLQQRFGVVASEKEPPQ